MIPRYLIRQKCLGGGRRLDKIEKPVAPVRATTESKTWHPLRNRPHQDQFGNEEYRFWMPFIPATEGSAGYFTCRGCCTTVRTKEERKTHMEEKGCTNRCVLAYKRLLDKRVCVICGDLTRDKVWGVPLHDKCKENWMLVECQPFRMSHELKVVKENERIARGEE